MIVIEKFLSEKGKATIGYEGYVDTLERKTDAQSGFRYQNRDYKGKFKVKNDCIDYSCFNRSLPYESDGGCIPFRTNWTLPCPESRPGSSSRSHEQNQSSSGWQRRAGKQYTLIYTERRREQWRGWGWGWKLFAQFLFGAVGTVTFWWSIWIMVEWKCEEIIVSMTNFLWDCFYLKQKVYSVDCLWIE